MIIVSYTHLVKFFLKRARFDLSKHVLGTKSLDTSTLGFGFESGLLFFVSANTLVDFFESQTSLLDFGVLIVVLNRKKNKKSITASEIQGR